MDKDTESLVIQLEQLQKVSEARLKEQEYYFRSIAYSIPGLIIIRDANGTHLDIVASDRGLLYKDTPEVLGKRIVDVMPADVSGIFMSYIKNAVNTNTTQDISYSLNVIDGERWFEGKLVPFKHYINPNPCVLLIARISAAFSNSEATICIAESGIGMDPDGLNSLFNIESKSAREGTNAEKGSGLGLILSKEFVSRHCGQIWAESEVGVGSKFYFTLPVE